MPDPAAPAAAPTAAGEARAPRAPTLAHRLEYVALRSVIGGLGALPWKQATAVGAWLGRMGYAPAGVRRGVVERQIAAAFPEFAPERVREVARASYESLGRTTIEAALMPRLGRQGLLDLFEQVEGWELLEAARARGRGAIVVTGHLGNWEVGGAYIAARGVPIDGIVRQQANPLFDAFLTDTRQRLGVDVVWDGYAVRRTPRSLRENRAVGMIFDQGALGLASTYVPFFGRPAKTPRGPAVFALRLGVPILFAASLRLPNGRFRLVLEPVPIQQTGDRERDVDAIVAAYTQTLERWVRAHPEQYFWQHRRWKHQPPDTPPHLREP
jgi:KDO2-lipid IV(A) lauroyltransferase